MNKRSIVIGGVVCFAVSVIAQSLMAQSRLSYGFDNIQDSARTKVWWFHGETVGTHEGITADLEAFREAGVGGVVYYDQVHGNGDGAAKVFSPEWWDELIFSSTEARRLGLDFECNASNGYVAGGKWITPDKSMQRLAMTETVVEGGKDVVAQMPMVNAPGNWYEDVALIAVPYRENLVGDSRQVFSTDSVVTLSNPDNTTYINIDFGRPFTARSITYTTGARGKARTSSMQVPPTHFTLNSNMPKTDFGEFFGCGFRKLPPIGELQVSNDGKTFRKVCLLRPRYRNLGGTKEQTIAFATTRGRYFRIALYGWGTGNDADQTLTFGNVVLSARAAVDAWQAKASLVSELMEGDTTPRYTAKELVDFSKAIDLTHAMDGNGHVEWDKAPKGRWLLLRFFSISNGGHTKHGRAEALGLECDKLSADGARLQWRSYVKPIIDSLRAHNGQLTGICMDSHEAGPQNWTVGFEKEFRRLRGYDMMRYLPVMAGFVVGSAQESDKFLNDLRHTINDLITDRYFGEMNRLCRAEGLTLTAQAIGGALCMAGDAISVKRLVDKPQAEFWGYQTEGNYDIKDCSSAAHLYGKQIASGEAFTDVTYKHSLAYIKNLADYAYAFGINEFVVCAVAYQPWVRKEGEPLRISTANGRQYVLNRINTLWPLSKPFWDYQARCSWMLRQGKPVSDICLYLGDDIPMRILSHKLPHLPKGFDFDAFTTHALLNRMSVENQRIVLPDGVSYRMMVLPGDATLTEEARQKIEFLRSQGAIVFDPQTDNRTLPVAINEAGLRPDVDAPSAHQLYFCHRQTSDEDIYFLNNHSEEPISDSFRFNVSATSAELWNPVTGEKRELPFRIEENTTCISLRLAPRESYFIVLGKKETESGGYSCKVKSGTMAIDTPWEVTFDAKMGGPQEKIVFDELEDWAKSADPRIRYFSGMATYRNKFVLDKKRVGASYHMNIPLTNSAAEVLVNGCSAGIIWCSPWSIDVTELLNEGENTIELRVCNCLWNRLVGDALLSEKERVTWQTHQLAKATDNTIPSGIDGMVRILISIPRNSLP